MGLKNDIGPIKDLSLPSYDVPLVAQIHLSKLERNAELYLSIIDAYCYIDLYSPTTDRGFGRFGIRNEVVCLSTSGVTSFLSTSVYELERQRLWFGLRGAVKTMHN